MANTWTQFGIDLDGEAEEIRAGSSVSLSADGTVLATGAPYKTINGQLQTGSVRVYKWNNTTWTQLGLDISGESVGEQAGYSVALSADGTILAIGAVTSNVNGQSSGSARVFNWNGSAWTQLGTTIYGGPYDQLGWYLSLNASGTVLAICEPAASPNNVTVSGSVQVYTWNGSAWTQLGGSINGTSAYEGFGFSVSINADGTIVAGGSDQNSNYAGCVRVYKYINGGWSKIGNDIVGEAEGDRSGSSVSLSADGTIVAIGSPYNAGSGNYPGSVRVYRWNNTNTTWEKIGLDIDGAAADDVFGYIVSLSADGTVLAVGSVGSMNYTGSVSVYKWNGTTWTKLGVDILAEALEDEFGTTLSLNANGTILAVGAPRNDGNGNNSGSVRVYRWNGESYISYYPTEADALSDLNMLGTGTSYVVGNGGPFGPGSGYSSWKIASNSTGSSAQNVVYVNGSSLDASGTYNLYPSVPCFLEGTRILCQVDGVEQYVRIEEMNKGTMVKTSLDGYKKVVLIGKSVIKNPDTDERTENRLYKCSMSKYPELKEDLYITGCHSILEFPITEKQKEDTVKHLGRLFVTDKKYRLMAFLDERAEPWKSKGEYTVWHVALENSNEVKNYGVYANGGLLVETCSIHFLKNKSNMVF